MSDSGSEADSRADTVGRKRKRAAGVDYSNVTTSIQISDTEDTDTSRPSSRRNGENHVVYGYKDSPTNAPLEGRAPSPGLSIEGGEVAASTPRSKESGELSSDDEDSPSDLCSPGESSREETLSHVGDNSDDDSRDGGSDRSPSSTSMSISSGDDYEPLGTADNHSDRTDLRLQDVTESEQILQYRYFHLTNPDVLVYCLCCGLRGHLSASCPERICTHCDVVDQHASSACVQIRKCTRCREIGHDSSVCANRTYRGPISCDICCRDGHVEEECARLWCRQIIPDYSTAHKIDEDLMHKVCYRCGESGPDAHWGDDCPMYHRDTYTSAQLNLNDTWSARHANHFIVAKSDLQSKDGVETGDQGIEDTFDDGYGWQMKLLDSLLDDERG